MLNKDKGLALHFPVPPHLLHPHCCPEGGEAEKEAMEIRSSRMRVEKRSSFSHLPSLPGIGVRGKQGTSSPERSYSRDMTIISRRRGKPKTYPVNS